ncbi:hypothetical protein NDA17_001463 [Ustilago hordei]|nr:hypothetical protein NDA17_001463 [Ustilago hordei]
MSSAKKNYEIHDKELLAVYRPGDKGGEPDALTRRTDMQPAGEEQDHNVRQLLPPRVFKETADHDLTLVAPMLLMESIASKGLRDLVKIFQPLDQELQEIHRKKPFKVKDNLWYSGGRLVIPKPLATPDRPWGSISLDFIEGLPPLKKYDSKTYDSILVIVNRLTKFAILAPTHKTVTAKQTAVLLYGHMPTIPSLPDEDLNFEVEALIDKCSHNGTTEYKVLWRGYSEEAASWEPVENLNCPDLIQEYEVSEGGRASRQSRERRREQEE